MRGLRRWHNRGMKRSSSTRRGIPPQLVAAIAAAIATIAAVVVGISWLAPDDEPELPENAIAASEVLAHPERYLGREITVTGEVDVLTDRVLSLADEDLIVVSAPPGRSSFEGDGYFVEDVVYATGELQMLDAVGVVEQLPHVSLLPSQFQELDRQPVLLASEVVPTAAR